MIRTVFFLILLVCIGSLGLQRLNFATANPPADPVQAPEFTHGGDQEWINSHPLTIKGLRGKVILIDFWTFDCWNCYRSFPWLRALEARLKTEDFRVIGVHTPEFDHEKIRRNIVDKVAQFDLHHPVMIDNDYSYWQAMQNHYWPAFYLIDRTGYIRAVYYGETHAGDRQAIAIEKMIQHLLNESIQVTSE